MKKYIFLDIDGVLNGNHSVDETDLYPFHLNNLKLLLNETNAKIVLSSAWRNFFHKENNKIIPNRIDNDGAKLLKEFNKLNIEIFDTTKLGYYSTTKGQEIQEWLDINASKNYKYIILDDENIALKEQSKNFIKTTFWGTSIEDEGLNEEVLNQAIQLLNK